MNPGSLNKNKKSKWVIPLAFVALILIAVLVFLRLEMYNNIVFGLLGKMNKKFFFTYPTIPSIKNFLSQPTGDIFKLLITYCVRLLITLFVATIQYKITSQFKIKFSRMLVWNTLFFIVIYEFLLFVFSYHYVLSSTDVTVLTLGFVAGFVISHQALMTLARGKTWAVAPKNRRSNKRQRKDHYQ